MTTGLTSEEAGIRLQQWGQNRLPAAKLPSIARLFFQQFISPLIYILLAAAVISLALEEYSDAVFIMIVLLLNAVIGTVQERSAERAAASLQKMVPAFATVIRDGQKMRLEAENIVPGDNVLLESGDKVPADIQLLRTQGLLVDESLLTGESVPVEKFPASSPNPGIDREDSVFAGSMVIRGRGQGVVTATGLHTELGRIATSVMANNLTKPPLLQRIDKFTLNISLVMVGVMALLFVINGLRGYDLSETFLIAVALAVCATPEGLPAAITVTLAIGMRRMAASNVIIRKLIAVESLGSCTMIASDKTGTLTINELTVRQIILPEGMKFAVAGKEGTAGSPGGEVLLRRLIHAGIMANEAELAADNTVNGDKVDGAFLMLGRNAGQERPLLLAENPAVSAIPYESENAYSASVHHQQGRRFVYVKGSPEKLIAMCSNMATTHGDVPLDKAAVLQQVETLAGEGYRVLALAEGYAEDALEHLTFLGLAGMIDPLRPEAREAVEMCRKAGIHVAMITGDHPVTARALGAELGLCDIAGHVVTGSEIQQAADKGEEALDALVEHARVFARIDPLQKRQIVHSLARLGHFVAVTGDGVNDAPALKNAHVGVAMGKRGTDVARESADIILTDDDFSSIVKGVYEGRVVYSNIRKVIFLLISTGAAEIVLFLLAMAANAPMPLLAVQLLWLNLVTNGLQHVGLAFEPAEGNELSIPPRAPTEPIFNRVMLQRVLVSAVVMGATAFALFQWLLMHGYEVEAARNLTLLLMVLFENMQVFNSRSETQSVFRQRLAGNPWVLAAIALAQLVHIAAMYIPGLNAVLAISPISLAEWLVLLMLASLLLLAGEAMKYYSARKQCSYGK